MKQEMSAGAVVFRRDKEIKFLLLHYGAGHWDFPKGHIEEGEAETETVKRETEEETGIKDLELLKGFKEYINYFYRAGGQLISKSVVFYLAKTGTEKVALSHEHIGFEWLGYEKARERLTYKNAKEILEKAYKFLKSNKTLDEF